MKLRVTFVIDVDPKAWAMNNGKVVDANGNFKIADVRDDIRSYVNTAIQSAPQFEDTGATVTLV